MTNFLRDRIAKTINIHTRISEAGAEIDPYREWVCECGATWQTGVSHAIHVTDAVFQAWIDLGAENWANNPANRKLDE